MPADPSVRNRTMDPFWEAEKEQELEISPGCSSEASAAGSEPMEVIQITAVAAAAHIFSFIDAHRPLCGVGKFIQIG